MACLKAKATAGGLLLEDKEDLMAKGKAKKRASASVRKPRTPAVIKAYSGSGYHDPGKYGTAERRAAGREIELQRD